MDADWITSPSARRVLQHEADPRPAWLWSQDGLSLIWQNAAAELFLAKLKKHGLKLAPPAVPIKGQVARNIRLGSPGRTSLARIQFLAGEKPASSTCATTPLIWQDGQPVLLIVGVDPIASDILAAAEADRELGDAQLPAPSFDEAVSDDESAPMETAPPAELNAAPPPPEPDLPAVEAAVTTEPVADDAAAWADAEDEAVPEMAETTHAPPVTVDELIVADESAYALELESWRDAEHDGRPAFELVPNEPVAEPAEAVPEAVIEAAAEPQAETPMSRLTQLVDRLAADEALYAPLTDADDTIANAQATATGAELFKVTGRGFVADSEPEPDAQTDAEADLADLAALDSSPADDTPPYVEPVDDDAGEADVRRMEAALAEIAPKAADPEAVERVSRYNFDELSRILNDRVGDTVPANLPKPSEPQRSAALINLGGETLVLNRLPLGILVFRDQQVLFANRAITEMVGYDSVEQLREAGLAAVFPAGGPDGQGAGPVNHLVQRDGTLVPVTARLQSMSWQGRPALMLSASATEVRTGHEAAVNAFAQTLADVRGDGFFEATRSGVISGITQKAADLLGQDGPLEGKPLTSLIAGNEIATLREFLDRPARFAETARPALTLRSNSGTAEIIIFAQGQAGVVTGYFGFVRGRDTTPVRISSQVDADPALLGRISRGVRRPLNTIIGFAELLRAGTADRERLEGYAQDIGAAGQEIASLVDELEDYARLRDGRYLPQRASIELTALLETCVVRIRQQASSARVFVRNAISETLPRVTADRASLAQAVLNLLASAIDQTPTGGAVVISAQHQEDGGIAVHVRDSSTNAVDMAERFVVFRDGVGRDGQMMVPVRSSVGLALTRSLLAVNAFSLSVDPAGEQGMLFTLIIPADLVEKSTQSGVAE
jgi:signal transduction histidine kinase/PAS domain-containing protein